MIFKEKLDFPNQWFSLWGSWNTFTLENYQKPKVLLFIWIIFFSVCHFRKQNYKTFIYLFYYLCIIIYFKIKYFYEK